MILMHYQSMKCKPCRLLLTLQAPIFINMHILLNDLHTFPIVQVGRNCSNSKTWYVRWSPPPLPRPPCPAMQWHCKENLDTDHQSEVQRANISIQGLAGKGAVSRQSSSVCLVFPITRPFFLWNLTLANKLLVNDKITALWQTNMYPEHYIQICKQQR